MWKRLGRYYKMERIERTIINQGRQIFDGKKMMRDLFNRIYIYLSNKFSRDRVHDFNKLAEP